jgi:RsiW-degrading membrane proteinase PrsW (M82 family)
MPTWARRAVAGIVITGLLLCNAINFWPYLVYTPVGLSLSLISAIVPALAYSGVVMLIDRHEREPARVLAIAFLWGALGATIISLSFGTFYGSAVAAVVDPLNNNQGVREAFTAPIAPIVEELSKGVILLVLFLHLRREFDNVLDGIVYGSLVGIGFAMTENVLYFVQYGGEDVGRLAEIFYVRAMLGGSMHAIYTAFTGAGLGYVREANSPNLRWIAPFAGIAIAIGAHYVWNSIATHLLTNLTDTTSEITGLLLLYPLVYLLFLAPPLIILLIIGRMAWRREARIITQQLRSEISSGVLLLEEFERLLSPRRRLGSEWRVLVGEGVRHWYWLHQFHQAVVELAFAKSAAEQVEGSYECGVVSLTEDHRQRIQQLRLRTEHAAAIAQG